MRLIVRKLVSLAAILGAATSLCVLAPTAAAAPGPVPAAAPALLPSQDPFYDAPAGYETHAPGTALRTRQVGLGWRGTDVPISATQILYRTTDQFGAATSTVTTVISPPGVPAGAPRRVVSYHSFYDALGSQCDPSYTLRGGNPDEAPIDIALISGLLAAGYTVTAPDYEGRGLRWTMARESGYAALDGIRTALGHLRAPARTPIGLFGYSGGSVPTGFGAELAPRYAPELNIVGAAAGGVVVNPANNLDYVNGSKNWAGVIPALMAVYSETYGIDLRSYLSPKGKRVLRQVAGECIEAFADKYPGLTDHQLLVPTVGGLLDVPGVRQAISQNVMGTLGTPRAPVMLGVGNSDGTGDGVMITGDVARLAKSFCRRGVPTTFTEYRGQNHTAAFIPWSVEALGFLSRRFAGQPTGGCGR
ncbi:lipase [Gordonia sp. zg691]|uniref:lipase family protein n=1 Tax=Gordonia jinghuaiqii TaxID=2758710 RepID=UPI001662865A|nr:lipase family protein [Gordonia jinghuaiqii]MBD0863011.1 lipase [Gordonia jinghuaiqii]